MRIKGDLGGVGMFMISNRGNAGAGTSAVKGSHDRQFSTTVVVFQHGLCTYGLVGN